MNEEIARLKRIVADQAVQIDILKEVNSKKMVSPSAKRRAINHIIEQANATKCYIGKSWTNLVTDIVGSQH